VVSRASAVASLRLNIASALRAPSLSQEHKRLKRAS
jgi:hypothetical protein